MNSRGKREQRGGAEARQPPRRDQARLRPIVTEIAELQGGEWKLGDAALGGLRAELVLPASSA